MRVHCVRLFFSPPAREIARNCAPARRRRDPALGAAKDYAQLLVRLLRRLRGRLGWGGAYADGMGDGSAVQFGFDFPIVRYEWRKSRY